MGSQGGSCGGTINTFLRSSYTLSAKRLKIKFPPSMGPCCKTKHCLHPPNPTTPTSRDTERGWAVAKHWWFINGEIRCLCVLVSARARVCVCVWEGGRENPLLPPIDETSTNLRLQPSCHHRPHMCPICNTHRERDCEIAEWINGASIKMSQNKKI